MLNFLFWYLWKRWSFEGIKTHSLVKYPESSLQFFGVKGGPLLAYSLLLLANLFLLTDGWALCIWSFWFCNFSHIWLYNFNCAMVTAGCWNRWRGWCYSFRVDGLHASLRGAFTNMQILSLLALHFAMFFFHNFNTLYVSLILSYQMGFLRVLSFRACWGVSSLLETAGWNQVVLFFHQMQRYLYWFLIFCSLFFLSIHLYIIQL